MAQISYGTITITDTTDIERIYPVYCKGNETNTPSLQPLTNWSENVSQAGGTGDYIWQRIVTKKQGIAVTANDYSDAVRLTGDDGTSLTITNIQYAQTQHENDTPSYGSSMPSSINEGWWLWVKTTYSDGSFVETKVKQGQTGVSVTATRELYWLKTNSTNPSQITWNSSTSQPSQTIYSVDRQNSWTSVIPTYIANGTYYTCIETTLSNSTKTWSIPAINNGLTNANRKAFEAANAAEAAAANAEASAVAAKAAQAATKWFVHNDTGSIVIAGREDRDFKENDINTYGYNAITAPGYIALRNNGTQLATFATNSLTFYRPNSNIKMLELTPEEGLKMYNPTTLNQELMSLNNNILSFKDLTGNILASFGNNGIIQSGNYSRGNNSIYAQTGTQINLVDGEIFSPYFRISDGVGGNNEPAAGAYIQGIVNANEGRIGDDSTNYWYIGRYYDYLQQSSAIIKSHGTSFIQLGEDNTWRLSTDRIHTGWVNDNGDETGRLHFLVDNNYYWDLGLHIPNSTNNKFMYIRRASSSESLDNLITDLNDTSGGNYWDYQFYVDKQGNLYANNLYFKNQEGTWSLISGSDSIYLPLSGGIISGNLSITGTLTKGDNTVTYLTTTPTTGRILIADGTSGGIKTSGYTIAKSVPSNALFTDENVKSTEANTTKLWLVGSDTSGTRTGTLKYDSGVYITTTAGTLHATTFEGNLSGTASRATADGDGNTIKTTYLKLGGGNVTGAVTFDSSVSADELTVGDLVVNGAVSFTNNLQANTINGVEVGASPKFTDTVTTVTTSGSGNAVTAITASNGKLTVTKGTTFLTSYTETDPIFVASVAHGITSSDINNWNSKTSNTGTVTSVRVQASSPLTSTTSTASNTTLDTTIKFSNQNKNLVLAGPSSGDAAAPTFRSLVAADIPGLAWSKITSGKPTTLSGYGITDAVPSSRKVAGHALTSDITLSNSDVGLGNVINVKQITNITNEFKDGQNTGKLVIWRGESDSEVLEVQITAREATSATNATNAQYATYDASEASNTTKTTIADKYIPKSIGTAAGDIIYWSTSGIPTRLAKGSNGQVLKLANGVPTWGTDNNDNTWRAIQINGTDILGTGTNTGKLNLKAGSNVTITNDSGTVTIASSYSNTDTKVNMKARGTTKAYLLGTTTAPTSSNQAVESVAETGVYFDTTAAKLVATTFSGALTGNASSATEFSSNATVTLTGDTTGTSAGSKKSWSIVTTNSYITSLGRAASADYLTPSYLSKVHFCLASSSMTTHKPPAGDGYITTYHWDNNGWAAQFYLRHSKDNPAPMVRGATSTDNTSDWGEWKYILTEVNYTDYTVKKDGTGASGNWGINVTGTAANVTGIVAVDHGGTGLTASPSMLTNLGSTTAANVLQTSPRPGITGTLGVANGGTGQTSAKNAANAFLNALGTGSLTPADNDYYISQYVNGGTITTTYHRRPMSALWNYISGKISSSGTYVTIATDQTITANQKTFNGAIRWGTASKYGAAHYDSTLEAIVFSFA